MIHEPFFRFRYIMPYSIKKRKTGRDIRFPQGMLTIPNISYAGLILLIVSIDCDVIGVVFEEIVFQYGGNFYKQCSVNALPLEYAVHVGSVAA